MASDKRTRTPEERWRKRRNDTVAFVIMATFTCVIFCAGQADQAVVNRRAEATQRAIEASYTPTPLPPTATPLVIARVTEAATPTTGRLDDIETLTSVLEAEVDVEILAVAQQEDMIVVTFAVPSLFPVLATQATFEIVLEVMQRYLGDYERLQINGIVLSITQDAILVERSGVSAEYTRSTIQSIDHAEFDGEQVYSDEFVEAGTLFLDDDLVPSDPIIIEVR